MTPKPFSLLNADDAFLMLTIFMIFIIVTKYCGVLGNDYVRLFGVIWPWILIRLVNWYRGF